MKFVGLMFLKFAQLNPNSMSLDPWAHHLIWKALFVFRHRHNNTICLRPGDLATTPAVSTSDLPKGLYSLSLLFDKLWGESWPFMHMFSVFFWICIVNLIIYDYIIFDWWFFPFGVLYRDIMFFCCYRWNNSINFVCLFNFWSRPMSFRCNMDMTFRK